MKRRQPSASLAEAEEREPGKSGKAKSEGTITLEGIQCAFSRPTKVITQR